jgi:hypothetical protein
VTRQALTDGPLPLARRRLGDAVHALADPQPVAINGAYKWGSPLYVELRASLRGSKTYRTGLQRSLLPCRIDLLNLLIDIDRTSAGWLNQTGQRRHPRPLTPAGRQSVETH